MSLFGQGTRARKPLPSATNLPQAPADDQRRRMRNYLISMGIRTVCFIAAIVTWWSVRPLSIALFVAAAVLPYVAVVFANATGKRRIDMMGSVEPPPVPHRQVHQRHGSGEPVGETGQDSPTQDSSAQSSSTSSTDRGHASTR